MIQSFPVGTIPVIIVQAEADVLDLCETACDVAADFLGLSDDQATHSFEKVVDSRRNFFVLSSGARGFRRNQSGKTRGAFEDGKTQCQLVKSNDSLQRNNPIY